ncbi:MAG: TaqI-like C-terminal specificity domain-containing protein, partial [Balneolales bacterium]
VTLDYLFAFLNAYDFSSEGSEEVQEDNKTLINASVLGLIFEKINGYKDGSFFTPGFITMYMCRETIRKAVVQKFKDRQGLEGIKNLDDIYNAIGRDISAGQANEAINSLKICDPAVGSGHFLVSALNEIIAIKSELGILMDRQGQRRLREHVEVVNDELVITDDEGALFEYHTHSPESRRVQEALFHEKQTLIENCLFGVDINPNSVKICRLRLWIELLKNAYYKAGEPGGNGSLEELETLPNIDINIKSGNSLISRFPLDADLGQALKKSKWNIESYRRAVQSYREAHDKEQKREMEALINDIKSDFRTEISSNDPKVKRLSKLNGELYGLVNQQQMFELNKTEKKARKKKIEKLEKDVNKLSAEVEEIRSNRIYENAFEWRFEFPEVLGEDGEFVGFDVVIGNPPYIRAEEIGDQKSFFKTKYLVFVSAGDIFSYFYEMSHRILRENGKFCFINNTFAKTNAGRLLRSFVTDNFTVEKYLDFTSVVVFEEATTYPIVFLASKVHNNGNDFKYLKVDESVYSEKENLSDNSLFVYLPQKTLRLDVWSFKNHTEAELLLRLGKFKSLGSRYGKSYRGIITGLNEAFVINNMICENSVLKPVYDGKDLKKWSSPPPSKWMIVIESKSTKQSFGELDEVAAKEKMQEVYPEIFAHLEPHELNAKKRYDKGNYWWELRNCAYYDLFAKPKIVFPNLQNSNKFAFDDTGTYLNAPSVFLSTEDKALLGILNSKLIWYYLTSICVVRNGGYIEVKPQYFEQIPIPDISDDLKDLLTGKVNLILAASKNDPGVDASTLEKEIDQLVYGLYGLSEEEIGVVEGSV